MSWPEKERMEEEEDDDEPHQIPSVLKALVFACMAGAVTWMIVTDDINHAIDIVKQHQWWGFAAHLIATIFLSMAALILLVMSIFSWANMFQQYCNRKTTYASTDDEERPLLVETDEIQIISPASPPLPCSSNPILQW